MDAKNVKKPGQKPVDTVEMWHTGGPSQGWMLDANDEPKPRIISVPIEAHFRKTNEQGFSLFDEKGFKPAESAKGAECPPEILEWLLVKKAEEKALAPTIEDKIADEVERRLGAQAPKPIKPRAPKPKPVEKPAAAEKPAKPTKSKPPKA